MLENGTYMVCDHSKTEVVFVSIIESEIWGVWQGRTLIVSQFYSQAPQAIREEGTPCWLSLGRRMEEEAEACLSGRRVTGIYSCKKKSKVSETKKIKIPRCLCIFPFWWVTQGSLLLLFSPSSPLWPGRILVPSVGLTTVPLRRMRLMKHGCVCFQLETLANSTTKGHLTEQKTCDVQSTMEIFLLQTEESLAAKTEGPCRR